MQLKVCDNENISPIAFISSGYQTWRLERSYQGKDQHAALLNYILDVFFLGPNGFEWLKRMGWVCENSPFERPLQRPKTRLTEAKVYGNYILKDSPDFVHAVPVIYSYFFLSFSFFLPFFSFFFVIKRWILLLLVCIS